MSLLDDLSHIGFTEYEAKVYLALLDTNPATGYQLSKASGVPRSMVYETLKRLHHRGAALEAVEGRVTLYKPLAPRLLLEQYEAEHQRRVVNLREGLRELHDTSPDDQVWSIGGHDAGLVYASGMLRKASAEAFLVLTDDDLAALRYELHSASERGVAINALLTGRDDLDCGRVAHHPPLESELQGLLRTLLLVTDDAEMLVSRVELQREATVTITRNPDLVLVARQFVWMELFTQRVYARLGSDLLARLEPEDRRIFESLTGDRKSTETT